MSTSDSAQETFLAQYHASLAARGLAWMQKLHPPYSIQQRMPDDGRFLGRLEGPAPCDYSGPSKLGHVAFEAKEQGLRAKLFYLSRVTDHQRRGLTEAAKYGHAFVLVSWRGQFVIPIAQHNEWLIHGRKSVGRARLIELGFRVPGGGGWMEWLARDEPMTQAGVR